MDAVRKMNSTTTAARAAARTAVPALTCLPATLDGVCLPVSNKGDRSSMDLAA